MNSRNRSRWMTGRFLLLTAVAIAAALPASGQTPAAKDTDDILKKIDDILAEIQAKKFDYLPKRRRDPFTFRRWQPAKEKPSVVTRIPHETFVQPEREEDEKPEALTEPVVERTSEEKRIANERKRLMAELNTHYRNAQSHLAELEYDKALIECKEALNLIDTKKMDMSKEQEKILRVQKAVERALDRKNAKRAFREMGIAIQGILSRESAPAAIINGDIYHEGELLDNKAQVHRIEPNFVIFTFRGYKIREWLP